VPAPGAGPATSEAPTDFRALFESVPGSHLVLAADPPHFTMLAASDERLAATLTTRAATLGRPLFEVFPDANPENPEPSGVANLRASLETVLRTRAPHRMAVQRYDLRGPDGIWEVRYWAPRNVPVLGPDGRIRYLIHHVEDVTDLVLQREATAAATLAHARSVRLQRLTAALAAARTLDDVAAVVVADMVTALGARTGALAGRSPDGRGLVLLRTVGFPEPVEAGARRQTLDSGSPLVECVRTASPVWVERRDGPAGLDARYPPIAPTWDAVGVGSAAFLPLVAGGEAVGAISFAFEGPRAFDPLERAFLLAVSQQAALAVERARLVDAERAARDEVERLLAESETGNAQLRDQALELELANHQLQEQATELEMQAETLRSTVALLGARTAEAEAARADAEAQRARAAGILETMADAHFVLDAEFRFVSANPTMARLVGRSRDALLGRTIWEAFPGTVGTVFEASYRRVAAERVAVHFTGAYDAGASRSCRRSRRTRPPTAGWPSSGATCGRASRPSASASACWTPSARRAPTPTRPGRAPRRCWPASPTRSTCSTASGASRTSTPPPSRCSRPRAPPCWAARSGRRSRTSRARCSRGRTARRWPPGAPPASRRTSPRSAPGSTCGPTRGRAG
jgi:PAS domain-containing protein